MMEKRKNMMMKKERAGMMMKRMMKRMKSIQRLSMEVTWAKGKEIEVMMNQSLLVRERSDDLWDIYELK